MFWVFLCMMPVLYINSRGQLEHSTPLQALDIVGWSVFGIGIVIQIIADYQKYGFKQNPDNKGKFMNTGVWAYSRHVRVWEMLGCFLF